MWLMVGSEKFSHMVELQPRGQFMHLPSREMGEGRTQEYSISQNSHEEPGVPRQDLGVLGQQPSCLLCRIRLIWSLASLPRPESDPVTLLLLAGLSFEEMVHGTTGTKLSSGSSAQTLEN